MTAQIRIEPPKESWTSDFRDLKATLQRALPAGSYLHHIGSTAVPGLAAKDIIDIQVTVRDLARIEETVMRHEGFELCPVTRDHCPPTVDLPDTELHKLFFKSLSWPANIHVREKGRFNQRYPLLCRDFLRAHPVAAYAYAQIKQRLADRFPADINAYYEIKDPVFDIIMDGACDWAKLTGWIEPPAD